MAWAFARRIPLVLLLDDGNVHDHSMIRESTALLTRSVEEAAAVSRAILLPAQNERAPRFAGLTHPAQG